MWLPETAADTATLELLAANGIKFTVLAPHQCKRIRPLKSEDKETAGPSKTEAEWTDTPDASVDTTRPYLVRFASGASIAVFFYNGPVSRAIAFEGLLDSGETLRHRLKAGFKDGAQPQLVHVATDGESYGHHHKYGEMALAYALRLLEKDKTVKLTNYGSFLAQFPPEFECEIVDNTSWSCVHGIERWRSNCGCNGGKPGWNQEWRAPLRQALDELRDALVPLTEEEGAKLFNDVWAARDAYIQVVLDRSRESVDRFFARHQATRPRDGRAHARPRADGDAAPRPAHVHQLRLVLRRYLRHRDRADHRLRRARAATRAAALRRAGAALESAFLASAWPRPNPTFPLPATAPKSTRHALTPWKLHLEQVAAHYAISSVFSSFPDETELSASTSAASPTTFTTSGRGRLAVGRAHIASAITGTHAAASPSPCFTSATRTSPPPSNPTRRIRCRRL